MGIRGKAVLALVSVMAALAAVVVAPSESPASAPRKLLQQGEQAFSQDT